MSVWKITREISVAFFFFLIFYSLQWHLWHIHPSFPFPGLEMVMHCLYISFIIFFFLPRKRPFFLPKKWPKLKFPISFWLLKVLFQISFIWNPKCICWPFPWGKAAAAQRFGHRHISQKLVSPSRPWGHPPGCVCAPARMSVVARFQICLMSRSCRHEFRWVYV